MSDNVRYWDRVGMYVTREFAEEWVHLRGSNTEPIIRIYAESKSAQKAHDLTEKIKAEVLAL